MEFLSSRFDPLPACSSEIWLPPIMISSILTPRWFLIMSLAQLPTLKPLVDPFSFSSEEAKLLPIHYFEAVLLSHKSSIHLDFSFSQRWQSLHLTMLQNPVFLDEWISRGFRYWKNLKPKQPNDSLRSCHSLWIVQFVVETKSSQLLGLAWILSPTIGPHLAFLGLFLRRRLTLFFLSSFF